MLNEIWHDTFHGMIPKEQYALYLNHSDEGGLVIRLEGLRYCVTLDFGITHAVNVLDEGVLLVDLPGVESPNEAQLRQNGYPSTLYFDRKWRLYHPYPNPHDRRNIRSLPPSPIQSYHGKLSR